MTVSEYPDEKRDNVMRRACLLKEQLKKDNILVDPFRIANYLGIEVAMIHVVRPYALTTCSLNNNITIYIADDVDRYSQKILCYHELGHIICEGKYNAYLFNQRIDQESEYTANLFMSQFVPIFSRQNIKGSTNIKAINKFVAFQIMRTHGSDNHDLIFPRYNIFDCIDINDSFWTML